MNFSGDLPLRADNAPLLGSFRALAEAPQMRGDPRVKQLLDSLVEIERERESFNAVGGVDPVFVALTARAATWRRTPGSDLLRRCRRESCCWSP